jgi:hypothetical protein
VRRDFFYSAPKPSVLIIGLIILAATFAFAFISASAKIQNEIHQVEFTDDHLIKLFWDEPAGHPNPPQ